MRDKLIVCVVFSIFFGSFIALGLGVEEVNKKDSKITTYEDNINNIICYKFREYRDRSLSISCVKK